MNASDFFASIQQGVIDRLDPDATFDNVALLRETMNEFDQAFEIVMGKLGICGIVRTPFGTINAANLPAVNFTDIPVEIEFWEDTITNRGGSKASAYTTVMDCALNALGLLIHKFPRDAAGEAVANALYPDSPTLVDLGATVDRQQFPNIQGVLVRLKCSAGFNFTPTTPLLDGNNQELLDGMGIRLLTPRPVLP